MPESDYLWKRDKSPDFSEMPFTHWTNSRKVASSNSHSVSIIALLEPFSFKDDFARTQKRNFVLRSPSSDAKNSGVHREEGHSKAAPWKTTGLVRFRRLIRSFSGSWSEASDVLSTSRSLALFTSKSLSSAMFSDVMIWLFRCTIESQLGYRKL